MCTQNRLGYCIIAIGQSPFIRAAIPAESCCTQSHLARYQVSSAALRCSEYKPFGVGQLYVQMLEEMVRSSLGSLLLVFIHLESFGAFFGVPVSIGLSPFVNPSLHGNDKQWTIMRRYSLNTIVPFTSMPRWLLKASISLISSHPLSIESISCLSLDHI